MNKITIAAVALLCAGLIGCSKHFGPLYQSARKAYDSDNWIETIDDINLALPFWKESDGQEQKAQAYQLLGKAYHKLKKIDKASESYAKAIELSTNTYDSAYELGMIYLTSKQTAPAIKTFTEALKMKKDDPWTLVGLGNAYYDAGNFEQARVMYQRVLDSSPGVREALDFLKLIDDKFKRKTIALPAPKPKHGAARLKKY